MNSLKKILIMATVAVLSAANAFAAIDIQSLKVDEKIPAKASHQLLDKVLLHNPAVLDTVNVEISDIQHRDRFSVVFSFVGRGNNGFPTEVYAVTVDKKGNFVDGALLGIIGDVQCLVIDRNPEMRYQPSTTITYDLIGDTIKVKRTYTFWSTLKGGYPYEKDGTIYNQFLVGNDGKLQQMSPIATAIEKRGNRPAGLPTPPDGKVELDVPTVNTVKGEYDGIGMNVLMMMQTPVSAFDVTAVNNLAMWADRTEDELTEKDAKTTAAANVMQMELKGSALCLRHADAALPWIATHEKEDLMADNLLWLAEAYPEMYLDWLKHAVNGLKDKNARKWWQKQLKERKLQK